MRGQQLFPPALNRSPRATPIGSAMLEGTPEINGSPMRFVGAGDALSAATSLGI